GLLPLRSWRALLAMPEHFGEQLGLSAAVTQEIESYLFANAGDKSDYRGEPLLFRHLSDSSTPIRITDLPMMRRNHEVIRSVSRTNANVRVRKLTNCTDCHRGAQTGSFALRELDV